MVDKKINYLIVYVPNHREETFIKYGGSKLSFFSKAPPPPSFSAEVKVIFKKYDHILNNN